MQSDVIWPTKSREFQNHHLDSTRWNGFPFRNDDVIVATCVKSGNHWMQQIVMQLSSGGDPSVRIPDVAGVDIRLRDKDAMLAAVEAQQHRRVLSTHLSLDALVFSPAAKYIYIGRDGRDVLCSLYDFHQQFTQQHYDAVNNTPGRVGATFDRPRTTDLRQYFHDWLDKDGYPFWPFFSHVRSWWEARLLPNVLFVHFTDLKRDLSGQMHRIADFLDIAEGEQLWPEIIEHCTFDWMKVNWIKISPSKPNLKDNGSGLLNKGVNRRWMDLFSAEDIAKYEARALAELSPECVRWLAA